MRSIRRRTHKYQVGIIHVGNNDGWNAVTLWAERRGLEFKHMEKLLLLVLGKGGREDDAQVRVIR